MRGSVTCEAYFLWFALKLPPALVQHCRLR